MMFNQDWSILVNIQHEDPASERMQKNARQHNRKILGQAVSVETTPNNDMGFPSSMTEQTNFGNMMENSSNHF